LTTVEEAEFTALVQRQSRFVFRVAYAVLLNAHDAEDAVQETFLKLYRNRGWQRLSNERAFLARVAWRIAVDRRPRSQHAATPSVDSGADSNVTADPPSPDHGPEETMILANQHALIHAMIDALPEELRLPLVLSASDELNSREIGGILGIPEGTVRTRLQRARQLLRQKLATMERTPSQRLRAQENSYA
jgi:RNA polymerase sigma-70 factor (ECF subfamily)